MIDIIAPIYITATSDKNQNPKGFGTIYFARPDALKGTLKISLVKAQPTIFLGVPRVWEKIRDKILAIGKTTPWALKQIAYWAKDKGLRYMQGRETNGDGSIPWGLTVGNVILSKVRGKLGLNNVKVALTGAAPIRMETILFFKAYCIPLMQAYGMSESTGVMSHGRIHHDRSGGNGGPIDGTEVCCWDHDCDGQPLDAIKGRPPSTLADRGTVEGEIVTRGRHVMMGYLHNEKKTREAIDAKGWLHSGDIGEWRDGGLYITGRIKELIITAGGENVAPVPIENYLKTTMPWISNAIMIGDKKKYMTIIFTLKTVGSPHDGFTDVLAGGAVDLAEDIGEQVNTVSDVMKNDAFLKRIKAGIVEYNKNKQICVSNAQTIQYYTLLDCDLTIDSGMIGPTLKLKRSSLARRYKENIDAMYDPDRTRNDKRAMDTAYVDTVKLPQQDL